MNKHTAEYAILTALALALSWLESLLPAPGMLPGMKLGLANLAVLFALYRMSWKAAAGISAVRVALAAAMFGNAYSFVYSLAGAALSLAVMAAMKRVKAFSILGVSAAGGVCHNLAQIAVAIAVLGTPRLGWYLPVLLASGTICGVVTGAAGGALVERVKL